MGVFSEEFYLLRTDCDFRGEMLPGAAMRFAQQAATDQCTALGMDDAFYQRTRTAFLLAKQTLEVEHAPLADAHLRVVTEPEQAQRAQYKRITRLYQGGQLCAVLDSRWVLVDLDTRRILRRPPEDFPQLTGPDPVEGALEQRFAKAEALEPAGAVQAGYSLCDVNGHLNNTHYADIVCDALPAEEIREKRVHCIHLDYHWELRMGEQAALFRGRTADDGWYFMGTHNEKTCFEAYVKMG